MGAAQWGAAGSEGVTPLQASNPAPQPCRAQNPAVRHELSFEMGQMHSDTALHFANKNGAADPVHETKAMAPDRSKITPLEK